MPYLTLEQKSELLAATDAVRGEQDDLDLPFFTSPSLRSAAMPRSALGFTGDGSWRPVSPLLRVPEAAGVTSGGCVGTPKASLGSASQG